MDKVKVRRSELRSLAEQLEQTAKAHPYYSQVWMIVRNACDHINALARIEEVNQVRTGHEDPRV